MGGVGLQASAARMERQRNGFIETIDYNIHGILPKKREAARIFSGGSAGHPRIADSAPRLCVPRFPEVCSEQKSSFH